MADPFSIYERLLQNVRKEIADDQLGIDRNMQHLESVTKTNLWLNERVVANKKAEAELLRLMAGESRNA